MNFVSNLFLLAFATPSLAFVSQRAAFRPELSTLTQRSVASIPSPPTAADNAKVVLITGASQGIGKAIADEIGKFGHKIVVNYIAGCEEGAEETVRHVKELGGDAIALQADCTKPEEVEEMFKKAVEAFGKVDVLINNAGITKDDLVLRMKKAAWDAVLNVNLSGVFHCSQAFFKVAAQQGYGRCINMASVVGQIGNPGQANYAASKGGVIALTKSFARELAKDGIRVNAICPGFIETPMTAKLTKEQREAAVESIPLHRLGKATEVAAMARFLAVDEGADYITGHCFDVDGGVGIAAS